MSFLRPCSGVSHRVFRGLFLAALASSALLTGCGFPMSPADLARYENHPYPGRTKAQVYQATITAFRAQGFEIIAQDPGSGLIKTGPKVLTATAYGNGYGSAVATENAIGWTVGITPIPGGVGLHADPRGYTGGQSLNADQMNGAYLGRLFDTLYEEIDTNLPPAH
jgi:hypothetical protein